MSEITTFETFDDVQKLYEQQTIPVLDEIAQVAVRQFLRDNNCENVGGALVLDDKNPKTHEAKLMARRYMIDNQDSEFYGPSIIDGKYYPNGIGVWVMGKTNSSE